MQKQLEGVPILMSSADRVAHIDGATRAIIETIHALPAGISNKVLKPEHSIYECLLGSVLTTFSAPPQILAASNSFLLPIPET